ncbi:MAG TPA: cytochrome P450 [Streptosporangiaceae bacterium]|nr:cytochrome P450 [Streptosporangiaceae bacterium]
MSSAPPSLFDLAKPAALSDPYPVLAGLREASPFAAREGLLYVTGRHHEISAVLRDPRVSSERRNSLLAASSARPAAPIRSFLTLDPPDHTRLRGLVSRAFTARTIARLEPRIRSLADELLTGAGRAGEGGGAPGGGVAGAGAAGGAGRAGAAGKAREIDVVEQLAYPLPVRIISELLGVPVDDRPRFAGWSARLAHSLQPRLGGITQESAEEIEELKTARAEFAAYFRELIARRRREPGDDLLSELIQAEDEGSRLTEGELIATCILLLVAGHETTVSLISNGILALLRHPDQLAALRADPGLASGAVEETLRYDAPVQFTSRVVRGGLQVGRVSVPDGGMVLLLLAAAGRDPAVYDDPDRFDIRRGPSGHLAFAAGPHFCLGAPLARLEGAIALEAFATRVRAPELAEGGLEYRPNLNLRGPQRLLVRHAGTLAGG